MQSTKKFLALILFAGISLAIILTISRPLLIPPGATDVTNLGWGWREFEYKGERCLQSPMGYMAFIPPSRKD